MSTVARHVVGCPRCGGRFREDLFWSLHVTRAPVVRDAILAGHFQRFRCPRCGRDVRVEPTLLYTDFRRYDWFGVFPRSTFLYRDTLARRVDESFRTHMEARCAPVVRAWGPRFRRRVVFGVAALREKLLCAEHGLDDALLECLKMQLVVSISLCWFSERTQVVLDAVDGEALTFSLVGPDDTGTVEVVRTQRVGRRVLDALADRREALAAAFPDLFEGLVVDWRAALAPARALPAGPPLPLERLYELLA